ncbi:MAG: hypothetical protein ACKN9K_19455, partial [Dolichospermum sp.]
TDLVRRSDIECDHPLPWLATLVDSVHQWGESMERQLCINEQHSACVYCRTTLWKRSDMAECTFINITSWMIAVLLLELANIKHFQIVAYFNIF